MSISLQEIYDQTCQHAVEQGCKSATINADNGVEECQYRGPNNTMCFVGPFIAPEHYHGGLEGESVDEPPVLRALIASGVLPEDTHRSSYEVNLFERLQAVHDNYPVEEWPSRLTDLARDKRLQPFTAWEGLGQ